MEWPIGTYTLVKPKTGCPPNWLEGWTDQDNEDSHNSNSISYGHHFFGMYASMSIAIHPHTYQLPVLSLLDYNVSSIVSHQGREHLRWVPTRYAPQHLSEHWKIMFQSVFEEVKSCIVNIESIYSRTVCNFIPCPNFFINTLHCTM